MRYLLMTAFVAATVVACNSSSDNTAENKDTMNHDMHMSSATEMPPMPEIPAEAKVFFVNLKDGQDVKSPLKVEMGVEGMSVDTANGKVKNASGHHHILIDIDSIPMGMVVPKDSVHLHFGNAQTSAEIKIPAGKHTLTLQFADALHRSYGSRLTSSVKVNVKE